MMKTQPFRFLYRPTIIVSLLMIMGFLLVFFAPIWLKPPFFEYTIYLYLVPFFVWLPVCLIFARRKRSTSFVAVFLILGGCLTIFTSTVILPNYPFNLPPRNISCNEYVSEGSTNYNCFFPDGQGPCLESGINYEFEGIGDLPLMRLNYAWTGGMCSLF